MSNPNKPTTHLYSAEAEAAVIGGLLLDNTLFDDVIGKINSADFYFGVHQALF
ncbi:DnaB-like helicase N-terminal domain-containing protein, partial [Mannheimia haemolytica]